METADTMDNIAGLTAPSGLALRTSPHADPNRRADEPEVLTQLVHEEPLIGEMELGGHVGEEDESRRRAGHLRGVEDPNRTAMLARRRIRHRDLLDELVQRG